MDSNSVTITNDDEEKEFIAAVVLPPFRSWFVPSFAFMSINQHAQGKE
jgi:hypothetical protein